MTDKLVELPGEEEELDDEIKLEMNKKKENTICCLYRLIKLLRGGYLSVYQDELEEVNLDISKYPVATEDSIAQCV